VNYSAIKLGMKNKKIRKKIEYFEYGTVQTVLNVIVSSENQSFQTLFTFKLIPQFEF
jgi:hypothetical protein